MSQQCIYCGGSGPFNREHVVSAGLGGDDNDFILVDLVCLNCNSIVFSPLELELLRKSPFALARMYQQDTGRKRTSGSREPEFTPAECLLPDLDSGRINDAEMKAGGRPEVLPQLHIRIEGGEVLCTKIAARVSELARYLKEAEVALSDRLFVNSVVYADQAKTFKVSEFEWGSNGYVLKSTSNRPVPPAGIWWMPLTGTGGQSYRDPRLFQRSNRQFVLRSESQETSAETLTCLRRLRKKLLAEEIPPESSVDSPEIKVSMQVNVLAVYRAIAKVGFNLACFEFGEDFVRHPKFDRIRRIILEGNEPVPVFPIQAMDEILKSEHRKVHHAMLHRVRHECGADLVFIVCLYGVGAMAIPLAQNVELPTDHEMPTFLIHYNEHRIERVATIHYLLSLSKDSAMASTQK